MSTFLKFEYLVDSLRRFPLTVDVMNLPEDTLDAVDRLSNCRVDRVVMVDIQVLEGLHLQRVDVNIQR